MVALALASGLPIYMIFFFFCIFSKFFILVLYIYAPHFFIFYFGCNVDAI